MLLLFLCTICKGQDPYYINYSSYNGLPSTEIYDVALDSNGIAWFCTDRGVCSFDGYEFKRYTTREGLSNNTMLQVHTDPAGRLWFLALDGSMSYTDKDGLTPFKGNERLINIVGRDRLIIQIHWDDNGDIYLVHKDSREQAYCQVVRPNGDMRRSATFDEIAALSPNGTLHGMRYTKIGKNYAFEDRITRILIPKEKDVYYVGHGDPNKLIHGKLNQMEYRQEYDLPGVINDLYYDHSGDLWICTSEGLAYFSAGDLTVAPKFYFQDMACSSTVQDAEGNFWVTTLDQGVLFIPSMKFHRIQHEASANASNTIVSLIPGEQHLFYGTQAGEVYAVDGTFQAHLLAQNSIYFGLMGYAQEAPNAAIFNNYIIQESEGEIVVDSVDLKRSLPLTLELSNGDLVNAGYSGFEIYRGKPHQQIFSSARPKGVRIFSAAQQNNTLWLGTMRGLLEVKDFAYETVSNYRPKAELLQTRINDILPDAHGNLWLGTIGNGLVYMQGEKLTQITPEDGMQSNMVNKIALDGDDKVWVASNDGVYCIEYSADPEFQLKRVQNYNIEDGLPTNFVRDIGVWSKQVWLATDYGLVYFSPYDFRNNDFISPVIYMEEVLVNREEVNPRWDHTFDPDQNNIFLRFLGVSNRKMRDQPFYRYRLHGLDTNWTYTNDRSVQFFNLKGGEYKFEAMARNKNGKWSARPANFSFVISSRFTETWGFYALLALSLLVLMGAVALVARRKGKR